MQLDILLANGVIFLASCVQTTSGLGFALVAIPLLAVINVDFVPGPPLFISMFLYIVMYLKEREGVKNTEIYMLIPSLIIGVLCGVIILNYFPAERLSILFAGIILLSVLFTLISKPILLSKTILCVAGYGAGIMGSISGIPGPPLAIVYQYENIKKMRATLALMFVIVSATSLVALSYIGRFGIEGTMLAVMLAPGLISGYFFANKYGRLISDANVRLLVLFIASVSAFVLLVKSIFI